MEAFDPTKIDPDDIYDIYDDDPAIVEFTMKKYFLHYYDTVVKDAMDEWTKARDKDYSNEIIFRTTRDVK